MKTKKCVYCANYFKELGTCKFCHYEYQPLDEDWDIFELDDDVEWSHLQIQHHLADNGIECIMADIWVDENVAFLVGCYAKPNRIADALGINEECIYSEDMHGLVIINLFQEKWLRGMSLGDEDETDT